MDCDIGSDCDHVFRFALSHGDRCVIGILCYVCSRNCLNILNYYALKFSIFLVCEMHVNLILLIHGDVIFFTVTMG